MNCEKFLALEETAKAFFIGSLVHVCSSDNALFESAQELIKIGERKGLFERTTIMPHIQPIDNDTNTNGVHS